MDGCCCCFRTGLTDKDLHTELASRANIISQLQAELSVIRKDYDGLLETVWLRYGLAIA